MAEFQFRTRDTDSGSNGLNGTSTSETVPSSQNVSIDSLGFLDTWSFAWVRSFYVKSLPISVESDPEKNINHTGEGVKPTLNISSSDSTHTNVDYFQDLYRHEEDLHGKINASMLRVCFALCRNRLLLASGAYLLYLLTVIVAITVFLREVMWATNQHFLIILNRYHEYYERDYSESNQTAHDILNTTPEDAKHLLLHNIYFSVPFVLMMVFAYMQRSFYEGKLLSTAIMLRNACAGAVFESSLKSSVQTNVASYQILTLCGEDGDAILEFIQKGVLVVVQTLGVSICMICGFFMVGFSTIWPTIGLSVLLLIAYLLSMASAAFYRKSLTFQMQKLSIADEYCQRSATNSAVGPEANNSTLLGQRELYRNRFAAATSGQFWALFRSEALRPSFSGAITLLIMLVFLTIVSAIYHETNAREDTHNLVALGFLLVYLVCNLVSDWSESMSALIKGFAVFDKMKTYLTRPLPIQPVNSPDDTTLKLSIQAATFKWETALKTAIDKEPEQPAPIEKTPFSLDVKQFSVMKNSIVGITGDDRSGKSSLVLALLGHMPHRSGDYRRSGSMSYYPEKPYVLHDCSIQMNIMFNGEQNAKLNESRYKEAVSTVQIHMNQGFDSIPMAGHALDEQWLQRISLARALYEESDNTIILENPLSGLDSNTEISDVFSDVATKLLELNKTVIVVSQDDNVLRHCQHIFLVDNGIVKDNSFTYDKIKSNAVFKEIIRNNRNQRELLRNGNLTNNLQTNLNLSTEDLVANETATASGPPSIFNPLETIYLIILNVFLAFIQTTLPLMDMVVYLIYDKVLAFVTMGFCFCLLIFNILGKHYVHRTARRSTKRLQRGIFDRLLHTPSSAVNESFGVLCLNAMLESNFRAFSVRASTIHSSMIIVFAILNLFVINGFWSLYSIVMIIQVVGIYFAFRHTMSSASELETSNRLKLYENVHNDLAGRVVLQSFNHIRESRNRIFDLMDTHSSSVYLIKSIIFFAQFIFTLFQVLNLPPQIIIIYHDVFNDDTSYMIALYLFFLMTHHIYKLIEVRLHSIITDQKLQRAHQFKVVSEDISTLKFT